ncbi:DnaJ-domain-containing protein, partial [Rhizodiscina lignyota]
ALDTLEKEAKEFDKDSEIDRIMNAFRLDAYAVLDLQPGVPESDIKACYRKKSLLIHPDKTKNPQAPEAFDRLKKAEGELRDEKQRARLDDAIADARMLLMRAKKWDKNDEGLKTDEFLKEWREKTKEVLIDNELRRRKQMKGKMQEEGRERRKEAEAQQAYEKKRKYEADWEETREKRIDSWRQFSNKKKEDEPSTDGKKKKKKMKVLG